MAPCEYCSVEFGVRHLTQHMRVCPDAPGVHAAILAALRNPDVPAMALSAHRYGNNRVFHGAPSAAVLLAKWGTWAAVCEAFGLEQPEGDYAERIDKMHAPQDCPHCGKSFALSVLRRHSGVCPQNPAIRGAILVAMRNPDFPAFAVSVTDYEAAAKGTAIPGAKLLKTHFGSWRNVVAYYGLRMTTDSELIEQRTMAEIAQAVADERRMLAEDERQAFMLPVYRVLPAPGLFVNGRECVRCVLR